MNPVIPCEFATSVPIELKQIDDGTVVGRVRPDVTDPVFAGHYPGFPLLPGVYILEFVHRMVLAAAPELILDEVVSCRFLLPVDHGEELVITVRRDGQLHTGLVVVAGVNVAEVLLRYREGEA